MCILPLLKAPSGGAFTGLRVGLATVKAWAAASGLPVVGISEGGVRETIRHEETGLLVVVADDPLACVARGGGRVLELMDEHGPRALAQVAVRVREAAFSIRS